MSCWLSSLYVVQRTCQARLAGDLAPWFRVLAIISSSSSRARGISRHHAGQGICRTGMVCGTMFPDPRLGDLPWRFLADHHTPQGTAYLCGELFFMGFIVTIAVLHLGNNAAIPVSILSPKATSSGRRAGCMFQWWYAHNAVGFFPTAGFLGSCITSSPNGPSGLSIPTGYRSSISGR